MCSYKQNFSFSIFHFSLFSHNGSGIFINVDMPITKVNLCKTCNGFNIFSSLCINIKSRIGCLNPHLPGPDGVHTLRHYSQRLAGGWRGAAVRVNLNCFKRLTYQQILYDKSNSIKRQLNIVYISKLYIHVYIHFIYFKEINSQWLHI